MIKNRDIITIHIELPKDRRRCITLGYSVSGEGNGNQVEVASSSTGGRIIELLVDLIAKNHNRKLNYES